ncbi:MAG: hypothetical protein R2747_16210 [Pyrinomonadaceae bacterium]
MSEEKKEDLKEVVTAQEEKVVPAEEAASEEDFSSELNEPRWSVVTFEKCVARGLTYDEAFQKMEELRKENLSGLCILTDEAAARIPVGGKR